MIVEKKFGKLSSGEEVSEIILENKNGIKMSVLTYGATIKNFLIPTNEGEKDIVLGFNTLKEYEMNVAYFGVVVGRVAGRIGNGCFELDGKRVSLVKNDRFKNHLHGGIKGLAKTVFDHTMEENDKGSCVKLTYFSKEGEDHYPGSIEYSVIYTLTHDDRVLLEYLAIPSCKTPISLTQHSYFNLNGESAKKTIYNHEFKVDSREIVELDTLSIPTGKLLNVNGGFFDLNKGVNIGAHFEKFKHSMPITEGFDHPFVLGKEKTINLRCEESGIGLEVFTTEPIMVCYSGNMLGYQFGKSGYEYTKHMAICLETQQYPNAVNIPHFPTTLFSPENPYIQRTEWKIQYNK